METNLPYVIQGGEKRYLAALPTPHFHVMRARPSWREFTGESIIPRSEWQNHAFETRRTNVPILDQNGHGSCVGFAATAALMIERDRTGAPFVLLSGDQLYTWINSGGDSGSNGGDAVQALETHGVCPASLVNGRPLRPPGISTDAIAAGLRFRLKDAVQITSLEEAVTAVIMRWTLIIDVEAGPRYGTDSNGTVSYLGRATNHEQAITAEGLRIVNGKVQLLGRNSWGTSWGMGGFGWYVEEHITSSNLIMALRGTVEDPQDSDMPAIVPG